MIVEGFIILSPVEMDEIQKNLLEQIAGLHQVPQGAYNIRANGESIERNTTAHIVPKEAPWKTSALNKQTRKKRDLRI